MVGVRYESIQELAPEQDARHSAGVCGLQGREIRAQQPVLLGDQPSIMSCEEERHPAALGLKDQLGT